MAGNDNTSTAADRQKLDADSSTQDAPEQTADEQHSPHSSPVDHEHANAHSSSEAEDGTSAAGNSDSEDASSSESDQDYAAVLERFAEILSLKAQQQSNLLATDQPQNPPLLPSFDLAGIASLIQSGKANNIIVMCGAGISVSAGIPDFRSPGTGLYDRLQEYNLPHLQAVFEIDFFKRNPHPFYLLAKELFPGNYDPTPTHHFIKLLHDKGLLVRCYTQNIDSLEHQAGLPKEAVIAAHGNFDTARCIKCRRPHELEVVKQAVDASKPCYCVQTKGCKGLVKPDIVFFGESLPGRFWQSIPSDFEKADLLIVLGTSLVVQPFASLIDKVNEDTVRVLINREKVGEAAPELRAMGYQKGFDFSRESQWRDVFHQGDCDDGVRLLCKKLGWLKELDDLIEASRKAGVKEVEDYGPAIPGDDV